jgi:hypothetical protein
MNLIGSSFHGAESLALALKISYLVGILLTEVSLQQAGESLAVASLVAVGCANLVLT